MLNEFHILISKSNYCETVNMAGLGNSFPISKSKVSEFQSVLVNITTNSHLYTIAEQSEANERYGIALFFYGAYSDCIPYLLSALHLRKEFAANRSNVRIGTLVIAYNCLL